MTVIAFPIVARRPIKELHRQDVPRLSDDPRLQQQGSATIIILPVIPMPLRIKDETER